MRLHIRRRDDRRDKKPGRFYFIDLDTLINGRVEVHVGDHTVNMVYSYLLLDTRAAHPREYADALLRFLKRTPYVEIALVDHKNRLERETDVLQRYQRMANFEGFIYDLTLV